MNSLRETQLGHELRELVSDQPFTPDLEAIGQRARQRRRRRIALHGGTAAAAAVLAAGGLFTAVHGTGGTTVHQGVASGPASRTETVAYVTGRVKAALANVNDYIDYTRTGPGGNSATNWVDPRTNNDYEVLQDSNGKSIAWLSTYLVNRVLTWKTVEADYSTRTWFVNIMHAAGPIQGSTAGATSSVMTPQEIKSWLDSGEFKLVGRQEINGHSAIGLRGPWVTGGYRELWVDAETFLPLRTIVKGPGNLTRVSNDTWLPRTSSLVNMVNHVHIPAGFRQVAPPK